MAAGQVKEKFLSQLAVKTEGVAKEPKNRDKKIGDIYLRYFCQLFKKCHTSGFQLPGI